MNEFPLHDFSSASLEAWSFQIPSQFTSRANKNFTPNGPMSSQKSQEIATSFFAPLPNFFPKTTTTTWILNRATPRPPHSRRKGFAHRGCSPVSFLWSKKTPQANTHGWFSSPENTQTKNGKGETNRPFCHQFLGSSPQFSGDVFVQKEDATEKFHLFIRGTKTASPSPFRAEKSNLRRIRKWRSWSKNPTNVTVTAKKWTLNFSAPRGDLYFCRSVNPPPKQGLFTPTKTAGAWLGFLGTNRKSSTFELQKSGQSGKPGHRFSPKEKTTEWKLNKLNPGIYPP